VALDTLTAVVLCAEITDFARFEHPKLLMNYVGPVPSEHSSGQTRPQGAITKSGSQHARRLLIEAAWHYRRPATRTAASSAEHTYPTGEGPPTKLNKHTSISVIDAPLAGRTRNG
jgi:transposase